MLSLDRSDVLSNLHSCYGRLVSTGCCLLLSVLLCCVISFYLFFIFGFVCVIQTQSNRLFRSDRSMRCDLHLLLPLSSSQLRAFYHRLFDGSFDFGKHHFRILAFTSFHIRLFRIIDEIMIMDIPCFNQTFNCAVCSQSLNHWLSSVVVFSEVCVTAIFVLD